MEFQLHIRVTGEADARRKLDEYAKKYPDALAAAIYQEGFSLWAAAVKRTPVEFGVLRSSAYAAPPVTRNGETVVEVGFGTDYAVKQHEETRYQHPRGGEAKYLETAMQEAMSGYLGRLASRTEANVRSGTKSLALPAPARPSVQGRRGRLARARRRRR